MSSRKVGDPALIAAAREGAEKSYQAQMDLLEKFCGINCGTRNLAGNKKIVALVDAVLSEIGAQVEHIETEEFGTHIVARLVPEHPTGRIVLHAHLDTAFFGDTVTVEDHPFHIEGEYAYGLGIADCKGGVAVILYTVKSLKEAGLLPDKEIVMLFNCDEEIGSPSGQAIFQREAPSAEMIISFEPGRNKNGVLTARRGMATGSIVVHGIAAHAGLDSGPGASATRELANLIMKLTERSDLSIGMNYNVAPISGGINRAMVADYAKASFAVPIDSPEVYERVKKDVLEYLPTQGIIEGCRIETSVELMSPPMVRCEENLRVYEKLRAAAEQLGQDLPEEKSFNAADCGFFSDLNRAVVDGLGPYMFNIHTPDEHMIMETLKGRTALLMLTLATC